MLMQYYHIVTIMIAQFNDFKIEHVPHTIITDNGRQFINHGLAEFYRNFKIKHITNGQAEAAKKSSSNSSRKD